MPKVPLLPPDVMQKQQVDPSDFLMAAADMHASGSLADAQRSAPMPKDTLKPLPSKNPRKFKVLK